MSFSYEFLDDVAVADLAFDATGDTLPELFQGATNAVIETMADPRTIRSSWTQTIDRNDAEPASLLFEWLSELVYWKDAAGVVFSRADLVLVQDSLGWTLHARLYGEPVNSSTQDLRADVKGVTKHLYRLDRRHERWTVRVVLDV